MIYDLIAGLISLLDTSSLCFARAKVISTVLVSRPGDL